MMVMVMVILYKRKINTIIHHAKEHAAQQNSNDIKLLLALPQPTLTRLGCYEEKKKLSSSFLAKVQTDQITATRVLYHEVLPLLLKNPNSHSF